MSLSKITLCTAFVGVLALSGCGNTFEGAGRDIEHAGEWIQNTF
jgi:predicted small secreted protein